MHIQSEKCPRIGISLLLGNLSATFFSPKKHPCLTVHQIKLLVTLSTQWKWVAVASPFGGLEVLWCGFVLDIGSSFDQFSDYFPAQTLTAVIATFQTHFFSKLTKIGFWMRKGCVSKRLLIGSNLRTHWSKTLSRKICVKVYYNVT